MTPKGPATAANGKTRQVNSSRFDQQRTQIGIRLLAQMTRHVYDLTGAALYRTILRDICRATMWPYGEAWNPSEDGTKMRFMTTWSSRKEGLQPLADTAWRMEFAKGKGQVGRVWRSGQPEWVSDMTQASLHAYPRREVGQRLGIRSTVGIPVTRAGQIIAVLAFAIREPRRDDVLLAELVAVVAGHIGTLLEQRDMEQRLITAQVEKAKAETLTQTALAVGFYLRNAIAPIIGYAQLVERGRDHLEDLLRVSLTNGRTITALIDTLEQLALPEGFHGNKAKHTVTTEELVAALTPRQE